MPGSSIPLATLGTFILWLGWFGFNGGSELKVSDVGEANAVALVFVNTNAAAAGGVVAALLTARAMFGKADLTMALNGALAGLVAITAEPLAPMPHWATLIGALGGVLVVFSIVTLDRMRIDDPVGAISVHGVVGIWGLIAVAFNTRAEKEDGTSFTFIEQLGTQLLGAGVIFLWVAITAGVVWMVINMVMGLRVSEEEEFHGVDRGECGLDAYPEFVAPPS